MIVDTSAIDPAFYNAHIARIERWAEMFYRRSAASHFNIIPDVPAIAFDLNDDLQQTISYVTLTASIDSYRDRVVIHTQGPTTDKIIAEGSEKYGDYYGRHRRTATPPHGGAYQAPGGAYPGAFIPYSPYVTWAVIGPSEPPRPVEDAGIRAGEITGLRAWRVKGGRLFSVYMESFEWLPGEPAKGMIDGEGGVHAFKEHAAVTMYLHYKRMEDMMASNFAHPSQWMSHWDHPLPEPLQNEGFVTGTVDLWGNVIEHERGYRAEFGQIATLDAAIGKGIDLAALRQRYGLDVP